MTKLNLFETMTQSILLFCCEIWMHEQFQQIEHRSLLRRVLRVRKRVPQAMIYWELGRKEFNYATWKRLSSFWKKVSNSSRKLASTLYLLTDWKTIKFIGFFVLRVSPLTVVFRLLINVSVTKVMPSSTDLSQDNVKTYLSILGTQRWKRLQSVNVMRHLNTCSKSG